MGRLLKFYAECLAQMKKQKPDNSEFDHLIDFNYKTSNRPHRFLKRLHSQSI